MYTKGTRGEYKANLQYRNMICSFYFLFTKDKDMRIINHFLS